ncbi:hypothetical protein [Glycomyces sp. MUSA5-2]|uniref:hypothetical protein n=1 Tax=Glycomyces sp. MUSA5-2 TaxID=2053002 RepID=UPI003008A96F
MTSIFAEAWSDTRHDARRGARRWLRHHPASNLLAWLLALLLWFGPKAVIVSSHKASYRNRVTVSGKPAAVDTSTTTTTTVTSTTTGGAISQTTTTTTTTTGNGVIHMSETSRVLGSGDLARNYAAIIDQLAVWAPVQACPANSIVDAFLDLEASVKAIADGLGDLNITFQLGNIDQRIRDRVTTVITTVQSTGSYLKAAHDTMNRLYVDQINQEASGVPMAGAPIRGGQHQPLETKPAAIRASLCISAWLPEKGDVVLSTWRHLGTNQYALSLWSRQLGELADRLGRYGVLPDVTRKVKAAAEDLKAASVGLFGTKRAFVELYTHQASAESVGATVIPIGH